MKRFRSHMIMMLCGMLVTAAMPVQADRLVDRLSYPDLNEFEIPQPERVTLDNGMTIYLLEDHTLPKINFSAMIRKCGEYLEPTDKIGLASMTGEVMRTGGTGAMTGDAIDEELEAIGAYVETYIGAVSGGANAGGLSEYSEKILGIVADVMRNPVFDEDKIELAKTGERTAISRRNDDPMGVCIREYIKLIYGKNSPYARHPEYATIEAVTRDDMIAFHNQYVKANNIQLGVVGDFNRDEMLALVKKYFGDWEKGTTTTPDPPDVEYTYPQTINYAEKTDVTQSNILIGHIGGRMGDPDYPATIVMNTVLGGSFGSRLTDRVRTKMGLAYAAQGHFSFNYDYPGIFYAFASTKLESTVEAIRAMIEEINSMQTREPSPDEMKRAKDGWLNSFVFNFDSKREILSRMMTYDYYGMPQDYLQQLKEGVENVTPQDVIEVARRKLRPEAMQILVVGKAEEFGEPLSALGAVNEIDITIPKPEAEEFTASGDEMAKGRELMMKAAESCGGAAGFKSIQSLIYEAKVTVNTPQGAMTLDMTSIEVPPDKAAQTIRTPMGEQNIVFVGDAGWISAAGQSQAMPTGQLEEQKKNARRDMVYLFAHVDQDDYPDVAAKGTEEFDGRQAERLDFKTVTGDQFTVYLDPETYRPMGMKYMGETMQGPGEVVEKMSDYQAYGEVMLPAKRVQEAGAISYEIDMVSITVNGEYDSSIFEKPDGI